MHKLNSESECMQEKVSSLISLFNSVFYFHFGLINEIDLTYRLSS